MLDAKKKKKLLLIRVVRLTRLKKLHPGQQNQYSQVK